MTNRNYLIILFIILSIEFLLFGISPYYRADWALENVLVILLVSVLAITYKKFQFSKLSYTFIFLFLSVHELGTHYTYSEVPYDSFLINTFDFSLNDTMGWTRNHFDRLVHLLYGLLLTYPIRELYCRVVGLTGFWGYYMPLNLVMATSMMYELIEWGAAVYFGGDLGMAYLGAQGDIWDAHKDMALASLGGLIVVLTVLGINTFRSNKGSL